MDKPLPRELISYQYGYCYIYAIALAHVFDKGITVVWDTCATTGDLEPINEHCLVHAFVTLDNVSAMDAGGRHECKESLIRSYPCNEAEIEVVSVLRMYRIIESKNWESPSDAEIDALIQHIKETSALTNTKPTSGIL